MEDSEDADLKQTDEVFVTNDDEYVSTNESFSAVPSPQELHEKYQEFLRAKGSRNNSSSEWQEEYDSDQERSGSFLDHPPSSNESNFSLNDGEVKEMKQKLKSMKQRNDELRSKNDLLLRNVETFEEENQKQKGKIHDLEKELKSYHELDRERENIHQDMEQLQLELDAVISEKTEMDLEVKRLKKEEELSMNTLNKMRDQIDGIMNDNKTLRISNQILIDESFQIKEKCSNLQSELYLKTSEMEQKEQVYQQTKLQAEECLITIKNLQDEKETLINEFREVQLEVSTYHNFHKMPEEVASPKSPVSGRIISSLQSELAAADPCGDGHMLLFSQKELRPNSPLPNEVLSGPLLNRSIINASFNSSTLGTPVPDSRHFALWKESKMTQTPQTESLDGHSQTDEPFIDKTELEALIAVQEHCTELKNELQQKEEENESLSDYLELEKSQKQYFMLQLETLRKKCSSLRSSFEQKSEESIQLTDILSKLCTNKLTAVWFLENFPEYSSSDKDLEVRCDGIKDTTQSSTLDGLALECYTLPTTLRFSNREPDVFQLPDFDYAKKDVRTLYRKMALCVERDVDSFAARKFVLSKCRSFLMEAIFETFEKLQAALRDDPYCCETWQASAEAESYLPQVEKTHAVGAHLHTLKGLLARATDLCDVTGDLEGHEPYFCAFKVFLLHASELNRTIGELRTALAKREAQQVPRPILQRSSGSDLEVEVDYSVDEVSADLINSIVFPKLRNVWVKGLLSFDVISALLHNLVVTGQKCQSTIKGARKPLLVLFFLLCCYLSVTPADYRRTPVW